MADEPKDVLPGDRGDAKAEPSGYKGDNPASAGTGETKVKDGPAEQAEEEINPSSPANTGTTPGTNARIG
jgi:hypothetical protein